MIGITSAVTSEMSDDNGNPPADATTAAATAAAAAAAGGTPSADVMWREFKNIKYMLESLISVQAARGPGQDITSVMSPDNGAGAAAPVVDAIQPPLQTTQQQQQHCPTPAQTPPSTAPLLPTSVDYTAVTITNGTRAMKLIQLNRELRKSQLQPYSNKTTEPVRDWIRRFEEELYGIAIGLCALDLHKTPLDDHEYVTLIQIKLDSNIKVEISNVLDTQVPAVSWQSVSKASLHKIMGDQFGLKEPDISGVLRMFGPNRLKKDPKVSVRNFHSQWKEQLPPCMQPKMTLEDLIKYHDLVTRATFYHALDDTYLTKALLKLPANQQNMLNFLKEAIDAESRKLCHQDATEKGNILDGQSNITVNKVQSLGPYRGEDAGPYRGAYKARNYGKRGRLGRGSAGVQGWAGRYNQQRQPPKPGRQNPYYERSYQSKGNGNKQPDIICFHCGKNNHTAANCRHKLYAESRRQQQAAEYNVNKSSVDNENTVEEFDMKKADITDAVVDVNAFKLELVNNYGGSSGPLSAESEAEAAAEQPPQQQHQLLPPPPPALPPTDKCIVATATVVATVGANTSSTVNVSECVCNSNGFTDSQDDVTYIKKVHDNILGGLIINDTIEQKMELDTAAGHCVLPKELWQKIVLQDPDNAPKLNVDSVKMNMADGTSSNAVVGTAYINIARADMPDRKGLFKAVIVNGPHVLLGREALSVLYPEEYEMIVKAGMKSVRALGSQCSVCNMNISTPVQGNLTRFASSNIVKTQKEGEAYCRQLCIDYPELFNKKVGLFRGVKAEFHLKEGYEKNLRVYPPAKVPHGIEKEYNEALDKLLVEGEWEKVDPREVIVASQLVAVKKYNDQGDFKLRLCGNYKRTINDVLVDEPYQFPTCNDQLDKLNGEYYTSIDLSSAYMQCRVPPEFRPILTIVTPRGYYQPTRMPYGVKTAPRIFQASMEKLLCGIPNVANIVDDICVTGPTPEAHIKNLSEVLKRLHSSGLVLNKDKCKFYQDEVKFLGKLINKNGPRVDPTHVQAIVNMPEPTNKKNLQSFLGHMSYVSRHIPNIRRLRAPLDALMKEEVKFDWNKDTSDAFQRCKMAASNTATLAHYDPKLPLVLTTDASPVGLGACLAHKTIKNGKTHLRPLSYASCSLKPAEINYSQIDREGLAVYWATKHYNQFLLGNNFELHTDCSALVRIFGPKHDLGSLASGRLSRWAVALMEYSFTAVHIKGASNNICDNLSRLPVPNPGQLTASLPISDKNPISSRDLNTAVSAQVEKRIPAEEIMMCVAQLAESPDEQAHNVNICSIMGYSQPAAWDVLPLTVAEVAKATAEDLVYGKLLSAIRTGDIDKNDINMKPFVSLFDDFYINQGVILIGSRIVIPYKQQKRLLDELHLTHIGIIKMKSTARDYFWWPAINKQIEDLAGNCSGCNKFRRKPAPSLCPWPYARNPMERVHIDYCEYKGKSILVMVDAYSKYIWAQVTNPDTSTLTTLSVLYGWFCDRSGFPSTLVSDNGPQFTSKEFAKKMEQWGIKHLLTPPYHPASNGLAEKAVGIIKDKLKKLDSPATPIILFGNIQAVLRKYRASKNTSTGQTPFELISKTPVPVMFPQLQLKQKTNRETETVVDQEEGKFDKRKFNVNDKVLVYDTKTRLNSYGLIKSIKSRNSYIVTGDKGDKHVSGNHLTVIRKAEGALSQKHDSQSEVQKQRYSEGYSDGDSVESQEKSDDLQIKSKLQNQVYSEGYLNEDSVKLQEKSDDLQSNSNLQIQVYSEEYLNEYSDCETYYSDDEQVIDDISVCSSDDMQVIFLENEVMQTQKSETQLTNDVEINAPSGVMCDNIITENLTVNPKVTTRRKEHHRLHDSLSKDFPATRLRPRKYSL